jgi:hypothetical protein
MKQFPAVEGFGLRSPKGCETLRRLARRMTMLRRVSEKRIFDFDRKAVGFWMEVDGEVPIRFVRVFVTYELLSDIDPNQGHYVGEVLTTFDRNRDRIDRAANSKFDGGKTADWLHEGHPVIVLMDSDF